MDVAANGVHWSESGGTVVVTAESSFYVLTFDGDAVEAFIASGEVGARRQCPLGLGACLAGWASRPPMHATADAVNLDDDWGLGEDEEGAGRRGQPRRTEAAG